MKQYREIGNAWGWALFACNFLLMPVLLTSNGSGPATPVILVMHNGGFYIPGSSVATFLLIPISIACFVFVLYFLGSNDQFKRLVCAVVFIALGVAIGLLGWQGNPTVRSDALIHAQLWNRGPPPTYMELLDDPLDAAEVRHNKAELRATDSFSRFLEKESEVAIRHKALDGGNILAGLLVGAFILMLDGLLLLSPVRLKREGH